MKLVAHLQFREVTECIFQHLRWAINPLDKTIPLADTDSLHAILRALLLKTKSRGTFETPEHVQTLHVHHTSLPC